MYVWAAGCVFAGNASAQNTSGLAGPEVKAGDRTLEYRVAYSANDSAPESFAHRLHYQQSLDDSWRLRIVASAIDREGGAFDFRAVQLHAFWQFVESEEKGWDSALVSQLSVQTDNGDGRFRLGWSSSIDLAPRWQVGGVIFAGREFGDSARGGAALELRGETTYRVSGALSVGAQMFSDLNTTADFGSFDEQRHQLGFMFKGKLAKRLSYNAGALFGVSEAAPDVDLRLFLARSF